MRYVIQFCALLTLGIAATGCIVDHQVVPEIEDPEKPITGEHPCDIENPQCGEGLMCAAVVLCESACPEGAHGEGFACPEVCVENYACVEELEIHAPCEPHLDRCGDHLACQVDEAAGCQPSFCDGEFCTTDCMAVFSCQPTDPPTRCEDVECGEGFECTIEVREGCGYADPAEQRACEAQPWERAICVPVEDPEGNLGPKEFCDAEVDRCAPGLSCQRDDSVCGPSDCIEDGCLECPQAFTCQPEPSNESCDDIICDPGYVCQSQASEGCPDYENSEIQGACQEDAHTQAYCVRLDEHLIGERCAETRCMVGHACLEEDLFLPCEGPGCDEPVDILVTCIELDDHQIGATCAETICLEGYECYEVGYDGCHGPGCDVDLGLYVTCGRSEPPVVVGTTDPQRAPDPDHGSTHAGEGVECNPNADRCGEDLACQLDENAPCEPSVCFEDTCTQDCVSIYTCQAI